MYGTAWKEADTQRCVRDALSAGFRAIDTANQRKHYFEAGVGAAIKEAIDSGLVTREELFLQTKFTYQRGQDHRLPYDPKANLPSQVQQSFQSSLEHLHTDHIDSYVLHGPATGGALIDDDWQVWGAMEELKRGGQVGVLGVSNINLRQLTDLCEHAKILPSFVQNRCYASQGWDRSVREYCDDRGIIYQGFSLLTANRSLPNHPRFQELVGFADRSSAQVIFRFARHLGMLPLTGTTDPEHMREDLAIDDFDLSEDSVQTLEQLLLKR